MSSAEQERSRRPGVASPDSTGMSISAEILVGVTNSGGCDHLGSDTAMIWFQRTSSGDDRASRNARHG